jgi:hypothetical protein
MDCVEERGFADWITGGVRTDGGDRRLGRGKVRARLDLKDESS